MSPSPPPCTSLLLSLQPDLLRHVLSFFLPSVNSTAAATTSSRSGVDTESLVAVAMTCRTGRNAAYDSQLWRLLSRNNVLVENSTSSNTHHSDNNNLTAGNCFFLSCISENIATKSLQGHPHKQTNHKINPFPPLMGFVKLMGVDKENATCNSSRKETTMGHFWVREHSSQEIFEVTDAWMDNSSRPSSSHLALWKNWVQERWVHQFCYARHGVSGPLDFYRLYQQQQQQQQKNQILRVPYLALRMPEDPMPTPPKSSSSYIQIFALRNVYLPQSHLLTKDMVDTLEGHETILSFALLESQSKMQAPSKYIDLLEHYQILEEIALSQASDKLPTTLRQQHEQQWNQLMKWVCEVVTVLEWPRRVAFRTAVLLWDVFSFLNRHPHKSQLPTASLVATAFLLGPHVPKTSKHSKGHNNLLEDLALCCDNRHSPSDILQMALQLWVRPEVLSPLSFSTPTVEQWIQLFFCRIQEDRAANDEHDDKEETMRQALENALDLAWILLPTFPRLLSHQETRLPLSNQTLAAGLGVLGTHLVSDFPQLFLQSTVPALNYDQHILPHMNTLLTCLHTVRQQPRSLPTRQLLNRLPLSWPPTNN